MNAFQLIAFQAVLQSEYRHNVWVRGGRELLDQMIALGLVELKDEFRGYDTGVDLHAPCRRSAFPVYFQRIVMKGQA